MNPIDIKTWQDFLDPGMKSECPTCGTLFGDECVAADEGTAHRVTICPGCGVQSVVGDETDKRGSRCQKWATPARCHSGG